MFKYNYVSDQYFFHITTFKVCKKTIMVQIDFLYFIYFVFTRASILQHVVKLALRYTFLLHPLGNSRVFFTSFMLAFLSYHSCFNLKCIKLYMHKLFLSSIFSSTFVQFTHSHSLFIIHYRQAGTLYFISIFI